MICEKEENLKVDESANIESNPSEESEDSWILKLHKLEDDIGYNFKDINLLIQSLTHKSSILSSDDYSRCNERMEFLGDSVLELTISSFLYKQFPFYTEGQLSKLKAVAVSQSVLASCSRELGLGEYLKFGQGEIATGGREKSSNLANALEALIAAIYLDGGFFEAEKFIIRIFKDKIYELDRDEMKRDYKTALQEYWQSITQKSPVYTVVSQSGPDHDKRFEIEVKLSGESYGRGIGRNKKEAEQRAAEKALEIIFNRRREDKGLEELKMNEQNSDL